MKIRVEEKRNAIQDRYEHKVYVNDVYAGTLFRHIFSNSKNIDSELLRDCTLLADKNDMLSPDGISLNLTEGLELMDVLVTGFHIAKIVDNFKKTGETLEISEGVISA